MATQTACALGDRVRAMISIAGGGPGGQCESPVTSMIVHGTNDTSEPISAGIASVASWAEDNDCPGDTASAFDGACEGYSSCAKPLYWCEHPGEHIVPSFIYEIGWSFLMDAP